jgi:isopenicillin-N N-acyltransferase like protein
VSLPRHRSRAGTPGDRGLELGRARAEHVAVTLAAYRRVFAACAALDAGAVRDLGRRWADRLAADAPDQLEEIAGIAAGAGLDEADLVAVNARTELLAGAARPECTTIAATGGAQAGGPILAQNWDWHSDLAGSRLVWTIEAPDGGWLVTMTEAGILAKIGLNSRRLGVCLNVLSTSMDGGVAGLPIHVLLRLVLERAGSVDEAVALLTGTTVAASSCVTVAQGPAVAAVELSPGGAGVVGPDPSGRLLHTNHFLAAPARGEDTFVRDWPDTLDRLRDAAERMRPPGGAPGAGAVAEALRSHAGAPLGVCYHDGDNPRYTDRYETLASVVMDLAEPPRLAISDGAPCGAPYEEVALPS